MHLFFVTAANLGETTTHGLSFTGRNLWILFGFTFSIQDFILIEKFLDQLGLQIFIEEKNLSKKLDNRTTKHCLKIQTL